VTVYPDDDGMWCCRIGDGRWLSGKFYCADDARLAVEKWWLDNGGLSGQWFESVKGGFMNRTGRKIVRVRQTDGGWYAVRDDGKLLWQYGALLWFATPAEAAKVVTNEQNTPVDLDPFAGPGEGLDWIGLQEMQEMY